MRYITSFDATAATSGYIDIGSADPGAKIVLTNLSPVSIVLNFDDGNTDILHAGQANMWELENITPGIYWTQYEILLVTGTPSVTCSVVLYNRDEEVKGTYPASLIYFTAVGNKVSTTVSGTGTDLINDGQAIGHTFIESTPIGQAVSSFTLTNDGQLILKALIGGIYHTQLQTMLSGNTPLIGASGDTSEVLGNAIVDGTFQAVGTSTMANVNGTNISASGTFSVIGISTFTGAAAFNGGLTSTSIAASTTLSVTGVTALTGVLNANGGISTTNITASGTLAITGASTLHTTTATTITASGQVSAASFISAAYYGSDASNTVLSISGTTGTGNTRLQNTDQISFQVPDGSTQAHVLSTGLYCDNDLDMQGHNIFDANAIYDTGGNTWAAVTAGTTTRIQSPGTVAIQVPGGSARLTITSTDVIASVQVTAPKYILSGSTGNYALYKNSLSRLSDGTFSSTGAFQTVPHNLGAVPTLVLCNCTDSASTTTFTVDESSFTSTTFSVKGFAGGVKMHFLALRY